GALGRPGGRKAGLAQRPALLLARQLLAGMPAPPPEPGRRELAARVRHALALLPEADQEVLLLRNLEGLSYAEVGCLLALDPAAPQKHHGRALLRLPRVLFGGPTESQA